MLWIKDVPFWSQQVAREPWYKYSLNVDAKKSGIVNTIFSLEFQSKKYFLKFFLENHYDQTYLKTVRLFRILTPAVDL